MQRCLFPSGNRYTPELRTNFSFSFNCTNSKRPTPDFTRIPSGLVGKQPCVWAAHAGTRMLGPVEEMTDVWRWEAAAQVLLCLCCSGWHLLLSCRWSGPAALGAAGLWIAVPTRGLGAAAVPTPGESQDQLHNQEQPPPWEAGVSPRSQDIAHTPTLCWVWDLKQFVQTHVFFFTEKGSFSQCSQSSHPSDSFRNIGRVRECPSSMSTGAAGFWFGAVHVCEILGGTRSCSLCYFKGSWLCKLQGG